MNHSLRQAIMRELSTTDDRPGDFIFWNSFNRSQWNQTLAWLDLSGLALYFWQRMKTRNAAENLPSDIRLRLAKSYEENCSRVVAIEKEFWALDALFKNAGVEHAVLKGLAMVPDYCPHPALRTQYDHDYLVRPDSLGRTEEILRSAGYVRKGGRENHPIAYMRPVSELDPSTGSPGLYSAGLERSIEIHFRLWDSAEERIEIGLPEDFLDRACRRPWRVSEYRALSDEDGLVFQVLHAFRHMLRNWCRLSVYLEISHFLQRRSSDSTFWAQFHARIRNLPCVPEASRAVFRLAEGLFGGPAPAEIKERRLSRISPVVDLWIERHGRRAALDNFRNNKCSLFLHEEFVDDRTAWGVVRRLRLFPMHRPHRLPDVLCKRGPQGLRTRWAGVLHAFQRFKFHALSALSYAWRYPQWRFRRRVSLRASIQASKTSSREFAPGGAGFLLASQAGGRTRRNGFDG